MPRIGKETVTVRDKHDRDTILQVEVVLNVSAEGLFTTTLAEEDARTIKSFGIELGTNGRSNGKAGFFSNKTKDGLIDDIKHLLERCLSREMIDDKIVLRYSFHTVASFGFTLDGKIVPNMGWSEDGELNEELGWQNGTIDTHAANPHPVGVQMFIKPCHKRTYRYLDNREKIEYTEFSPFGGDEADKDRYYLKWLENVCSTKQPSGGKMQEIDYTEERAKFFVEMFKSICQLAHTIAHFNEPEELTKLIESGKYLMAPKDENEKIQSD